MALGKGPTHVALRQGISNPPWKALAVRAVQLSQQHKPLRAHGHQQTLPQNIAVLIDPEDGHLEMGACIVSQHVEDGSCRAHAYDLIAQRLDGSRDGGLAHTQPLSQGQRFGGATSQHRTDVFGIDLGG